LEYAPGDPAPHFNLKDTAGRATMLYDFFDQAHVVLAFLPPGDAAAASGLAAALGAALPRFRGAGAELVAILADSAAAVKAFAEARSLPFPLLADDDRSVSREYGAVPEGDASLFVVDRRGDVRLVLKSADPAICADAVLEVLRALPA
jgi:peroxiredoxin Q/BCP